MNPVTQAQVEINEEDYAGKVDEAKSLLRQRAETLEILHALDDKLAELKTEG